MRRRAGIERDLASRADQRVLRWFGHVERMVEFLSIFIHLAYVKRIGQKGVDDGRKLRAGTRETEVNLNGW